MRIANGRVSAVYDGPRIGESGGQDKMSEGVLDHRLPRSLRPHDIGHHRAEKRLSRPQKSEDGGDGGHGDAERGAKRNLEAASDLAKVRPLRQGPVDGSAAIRKHRNPSLHSGRRNVHPNQTSAVSTNSSGDKQLQVETYGDKECSQRRCF